MQLWTELKLQSLKEQVHFFGRKLNVKGVIITFTDNFITKNTSERNLFHFLQLYHSTILQIDSENITLLTPFIDLLFREQQAGNTFLKEDMTKSIFMSLLIQLKRLIPLENSFIDNQRFRDFIKFKQLIATDFSNTHNVKDYAKKMSVSYNYLNEVCKQITGNTAKSFIDNWLILEIKRNISENNSVLNNHYN